MNYIKPKEWSGKTLTGEWIVSLKLDGVRALYDKDNQSVVSRKGKPLYNLEDAFRHEGLVDAEVFDGSWNTTVSSVRTKEGDPISSSCLYSLWPVLDSRLYLTTLIDPSVEDINKWLAHAVAIGAEGLVLRQDNVWIKVKPTVSLDVEVLSVLPGKGRLQGMMGALLTPVGRIGQGFTDEERREPWEVGETIEISFREITAKNKVKEGRFIRRRFDK